MKALVFDVFGTVVDWRSGIARDAETFLAKHGRGDVDPHAFADAWRRRYQPAMEEVRSGRRPFTRLDVLHRENLDLRAARPRHRPGGIGRPSCDWLNRAWHRLDPWPDTIPGLIRLKAKHFIAPLSNGNILLLANMAKRAGIPWDAILGAEPVQAYKPQPEAYLRTAEILGRPGRGLRWSPRTTATWRRRGPRARHRLRRAPGRARAGQTTDTRAQPRPGTWWRTPSRRSPSASAADTGEARP